MEAFFTQLENILWAIFYRPNLSDIFDILIMAFIIYKLIMITKETRASAVVKGLLLLLFANWISGLLGLTSLNWLLTNIINNGTLVLVVLFQPEIRKVLEHLGLGTILHSSKQNKYTEESEITQQLTTCMLNLSRKRIGALIVIEQHIGLKDVIETGTLLNADISSMLLENIFEPNTPLHDGAVVIRENKIMAAGCFLTLSEDSGISKKLGTRHRAGVGITELTDSICFIVSEETGIISMAKGGKLTRHLTESSIKQFLNEIYSPISNVSLRKKFLLFIKTLKKG